MINNRNLADIILGLHENCRSGILRIEKGSEKKQLVILQGLLAFAESNHPEDHLAKIMVKQGILPKFKMAEITALMKKGMTSEEAFLALPDTEAQDVEKGRLEQAISILASLLAWSNYEVHFYEGAGLVRYQLNLGKPLPEMLVLSARRAVSNRWVSAPKNFVKGSYSKNMDFAEKAPVLPLNRIETTLFSMVQDPMNTSDLLSSLAEETANPKDSLLCLSVLGLIRFDEPKKNPDQISSSADLNSVLRPLEDMLLQFEIASYYEVLGVPFDANQEQIQLSYHDLAKQYHPDRYQSKEFSAAARRKAQQVFTCINEAYLTLKDPASRAAYNEKRSIKEIKGDSGSSRDEKTAEALFQSGLSMIAKGEYEQAVERLKGCVWLRPENAPYHHYLGVAEAKIPKLRRKSEQHLLKAIELDAMFTESRLELVKLYLQFKLRRKAETQLQELLHWDPDNQEALQLMARLENVSK
jgi:tetratricopeptide (TPR) repeat protein